MFFTVASHDADTVPSPPWRSMRELVDDPAVLSGRVSAIRSYLAAGGGRSPEQVPVRVAASVAHLGLVARLVSPAFGSFVHSGVLAAPELAELWWQPESGGAFPLSVGVVARSAPGLLIAGAVRDLTLAVREFSVSEQVLWGNVASAINGAATVVGAVRPDLAARAGVVADELLGLPPLRGAGTRRADGGFQRRSCCLIYRASATRGRAAVCGDCVLTG
jgi:hypothetical protein